MGFADTVSNLMDQISTWKKIPASLNDAEPFLPGLLDRPIEEEEVYDPSVDPMDVEGDSYPFIGSVTSWDDKKPAYITLVQKATAQMVRGRVASLRPQMVRIRTFAQLNSKNMLSDTFYGRWKKGVDWQCINNRSGTYTDPGHQRVIHGAFMIAWSRDYQWTVSLGEEGGLRLLFPTDRTGAIESFRLREVPSGKSRRAALLHWVDQHFRKKRDSSLTEVRKYLRGAEDFHWSGLECRIKPSPFDLRELQKLKGA